MSNINKIQKEMGRKGLSALLLTDEVDRLYATGFHSTAGALLILADKAYFITDSRYIEAAGEKISNAEVLQSTTELPKSAVLKGLLSKNGISRLGAQDASLSYRDYLQLEKDLGIKFFPAQDICTTLRRVKEQYEVDNIVAAQRIAEKAFDFVLGYIKPGLSEKDVAAELEYRMMKGGAEGLSFETICVAGPNSSRPHGVPGDYKVQDGDFLTMDFGCKIGGYCSDMTRTVAIGSASDEMHRVYDVVLEAQLAGIAAFHGGVIGRDVDLAARAVIEKAGYGEYFGHGFGHSVGLLIHESPNANLKENGPLPAGAVVTAEPGIYLPGKFGVRIEDMLLIKDGGSVNLTQTPKELIIL